MGFIIRYRFTFRHKYFIYGKKRRYSTVFEFIDVS